MEHLFLWYGFRLLMGMKSFSTVLFVEGSPIGYKVCLNDDHNITMNPAENPGRAILPPVLYASNVSGNWQIKGTRNPDLIAQAMEELRYNMDFSPHPFTAAP